jgi:hypothetical protein
VVPVVAGSSPVRHLEAPDVPSSGDTSPGADRVES